MNFLRMLKRLFRATPDQVSQVALEIAGDRGVLPTSLGSAEIRDRFAAEVRARAVFSSRTTSAHYLQGLKDAVDLALQGGYENDVPMMRLRLKEELARLGYTPETGFPGDAALEIPPALPGSLQDLSSDRRINLILETQISLARGASQRMRGLERGRRERYPAWELVRVYSRKTPRGEADTIGWAERWTRLGGPIVPGGRFVALKDDPIWAALGDPVHYRDALGVEHPPFAYQSGMRWVEIAKDEAESLGLLPAAVVRPMAEPTPAEALPEPEASLRGLDEDLRRKLIEGIKAKRAAKPDHVRFSEQLTEELRKAGDAYLAAA